MVTANMRVTEPTRLRVCCRLPLDLQESGTLCHPRVWELQHETITLLQRLTSADIHSRLAATQIRSRDPHIVQSLTLQGRCSQAKPCPFHLRAPTITLRKAMAATTIITGRHHLSLRRKTCAKYPAMATGCKRLSMPRSRRASSFPRIDVGHATDGITSQSWPRIR